MCHSFIILSKNEDGRLLYCRTCKVYQLYFNNLYLELSQRELETFKSYLSEIDIHFWESCPNRAALKRRIPIPTMQRNLILTFCKQELQSLKDIVFENTISPDRSITASEIDYHQILN